jgi:hypothetical protein
VGHQGWRLYLVDVACKLVKHVDNMKSMVLKGLAKCPCVAADSLLSFFFPSTLSSQ